MKCHSPDDATLLPPTEVTADTCRQYLDLSKARQSCFIVVLLHCILVHTCDPCYRQFQSASATNLAAGTAMMAAPGECERNLTLHACQRVRVGSPHRCHLTQLSDRQIDVCAEWRANVRWR